MSIQPRVRYSAPPRERLAQRIGGAVHIGLAGFVIGLERVEVAAAERADLVVEANELAAAAAQAQLRRDPALLSH